MLRRSALIVAIAALVAGALGTASATANFHLTKISEVFPGTAACPDCSFVELQAYAAGQNVVAGHMIRSYGATGSVENSFTIPAGVPNPQSQRTILVADSSVAGRDFTNTALGTNLVPAGGAVCFDALDCVAWGSFTGFASLPVGADVGTPAAASGIPDTNSLVRRITPGCETLLEATDDSNDSAADFSLSTVPSPRGNSVAPTERSCSAAVPQTAIDSGPKKRIKGKTARFEFSSPEGAATFECRLDDKPFKPCTSPHRVKRIKPGKHVFNVRAVLGAEPDPTPAKYGFKRKKK